MAWLPELYDINSLASYPYSHLRVLCVHIEFSMLLILEEVSP